MEGEGGILLIYVPIDMLKESSEGIILAIKVIPKSHRDEIIGWENEELKIRLKAVPDKGNANGALMYFLAKYLHLPLSSLTLIYGFKSRHKRVCIKGLKLNQLVKMLCF